MIAVTSRSLTTSASQQEQASVQVPRGRVSKKIVVFRARKAEGKLRKSGASIVGSRRRRAAVADTTSIPFEQLPYQCFQEARKILQADREQKLKQIEEERKRIAKVQAQDAALCGGEASKKGRLIAMQKYLEHLKILADSNDPLIKKRFEDGEGIKFTVYYIFQTPYAQCLLDSKSGDMNRPIYRYYADRKWRSYRRVLMVQRIAQMHIVPDILPFFDPVVEVSLAFGRREVKPGEFVDSRVSEFPAKLRIQVFDKGERLVTIVMVDPDVPIEATDGFDYRCHFLAVNVPVSPTSTVVHLSRLNAEAPLMWLPPFAQKGAPYHRMPIFVLQQPPGVTLDVNRVWNKVERDGFNLRSFNEKHKLTPVGMNLFRSQWDEGTEHVMKRAGMEGADLEFRRKKPDKLPYKKKDGARFR